MKLVPRPGAVAESYQTFWDETPPVHVAPILPALDAYAVFVNLTDDKFPEKLPAGAVVDDE